MYQAVAIGWDVGGWSGKNHGLCALGVKNNRIEIVQAPIQSSVKTLPAELKKFLQLPAEQHCLAIDAPLGFPKAFNALLNSGETTSLFNEKHAFNPLAWRATDIHIKQLFKSPLSATFSFLTSNATLAISMIKELKLDFDELSCLPFDKPSNTKNAIEVYPALLNANYPFAEQYKKQIAALQFESSDGADYYFTKAGEKTDRFDALICALFGLSYLEIAGLPPLEKQIPSQSQDLAKQEGWIFYPKI